MIVHDFYVEGIGFRPGETNAELIVNADAMLPLAITPQSFQVMSGDCRQVLQGFRCIQRGQPLSRDALDGMQCFREFVPVQLGRFFVSKTADHVYSV